MFLQRVDNVFDLEWGGGVKYGEVRLQEEIEQSKYAFGQVDMPAEAFAELHRDLFDQNYAFAEKLLASGLIWPALEHCLKCSHLFNILDSSGSIGVTERTAYILRVRQLAVRIARAYVGDPAPGSAEKRRSDGPRAADRDRVRRDSGELAAGPDPPDCDASRCAPQGVPADAGVAGRELQHAAAADRAGREAGRASDRLRGAGDRPAGVGGVPEGRRRRRLPRPALRRNTASR